MYDEAEMSAHTHFVRCKVGQYARGRQVKSVSAVRLDSMHEVDR